MKRIEVPLPAPNVSRIMKANKATGTKLELVIRRELWRKGYRGYRVNYKKLPGKPDIAYPTIKLAIFVHGCFWHSCPKCNRSSPKTNESFWREKFERNRKRDIQVVKKITDLGWQVLVLWECDIKSHLGDTVEKVERALSK